MAQEDRIYIDDVTGKQLKSADDATNGGARMLHGADAENWLAANKDKAIGAKAVAPAEPEAKAVAPAENKARGAAENKGG